MTLTAGDWDARYLMWRLTITGRKFEWRNGSVGFDARSLIEGLARLRTDMDLNDDCALVVSIEAAGMTKADAPYLKAAQERAGLKPGDYTNASPSAPSDGSCSGARVVAGPLPAHAPDVGTSIRGRA